jgi:transposase-like protein
MYVLIRPEYEHDPDCFCPDNPRVRRVKAAIERLPDADKVIIRLYAELGSLRKLAGLLGVGRDTMGREVRRIRTEIMRLMRQ